MADVQHVTVGMDKLRAHVVIPGVENTLCKQTPKGSYDFGKPGGTDWCKECQRLLKLVEEVEA